MEDLARWSKRSSINSGEFAALFRQAYGLESWQDSPDYPAIWQKAAQDFRNSFQYYLSLLGVVPQGEFAKLARKYEGFEKRLAEKEETIQNLRQLLAAKGLDHAAVTLEFQQLMKKQGEQFQKLMKNFGEAFQGLTFDSNGSYP